MSQSIGEIALDLVINKEKYSSQMAGIQNMAKKAGLTLAAAFSVKGITDFGKQCLELGSDLQEVQNVVDVTFPSMKEKVNEFAQSAAQSFGLSETMAKKYTGTFGAMSKAFGFSESEAYEMGSALTKLSGDVASFYNITQDEAYTKLKSVFTGETETLKDLGVVMTQTALDAYALENGFGKTTKSMSEAEKVALRYQFVQEKLSAASGDFVRTSGGWANQVRVLTLQFDSLKATLGQGFINLFTPIIKGINGVIAKLQTLANAFKSFTEYITGNDTEESTSGISSGLSEATDAANSLESATSGVGDAAKKAAKELKGVMSYDEVNNISGDSDETSSGTSGESVDFGNISADEEKLADKFDAITGRTEVFFDKIKKIVEDFKIGDYFQAGQDTSGLVADIFDFFSEAIDKVNWDKLGDSIGEYLAGVDWYKVIKSAFKLKFNIWKAIAEVWFGSFKAAPIETAVITGIGALKFTGLGKKVAPALGKAIMGSSLVSSMTSAWASLGGIGGILATDVATVIGSGTVAEIGLTIGTALIGGMAAAVGGWNIGQMIAKKLNFFGAADIVDSMSFLEQMKYIGDWAKEGIDNAIISFIKFGSELTGVSGSLKAVREDAISAFNSETWGTGFENVIRDVTGVRNGIEQLITSSKNYVNDAGMAEAKLAESLAEKYYALAEKENLTNEEKTLMKKYAEELVSVLPEASEYIDKETGYITAQKDEIQKLIEKQLEHIKIQAMQDKLVEMYKQQMNASEDLQAMESKLLTSKEALQKAQEAYDASLKKGRNSLGEYLVAGDKETAALKEAQAQYEALRNEQTEMVVSYNRLGTAVRSFESDITSMMSGTYSSGENAGFNIVEGLNNGIEDNSASSREAISRWTESGVVDAMYEGLDEHSPSKISYGAGENFIIGFNNAIDDKASSTSDAVSRYTGLIVSEMTKIKSPLTDSGTNAMQGFIEGFRGKFSEFGDTMSEWWDKKVKPWFSKDKWVEGMSGIKDAFRETFKNACNAAAEKFNKFITWLNEKMNISWEAFSVAGKEIIPAGSVQLVNIPKIPMLANGGYVRANTPQLAIIGDNRHYGEITAPEDKMEAMAKQAALEALKNRGSDNNADNPQPVTVKVYLEGDSKKIFRVVRTENEAYRQQTGHPAFV